MEEIKKINDDDLGKASGGVTKHDGVCFRCGSSDSFCYDYCNHKWYGQLCCEKCFKILSDREEKSYESNNNEILKQIKSLQDKIDNLSNQGWYL